MSDAVFPTLPGLDIKVTRSEVYSTLVQAGASGKELRASIASTPRYAYTLRLNFLRQAGYGTATFDELATLKAFFDARMGRLDTFLYDDPVDGVRRRVRFDQDTMDLERIASGIWDGKTLKLITVK